MTQGMRGKYTRSHVIVSGIDSQRDMDLMAIVDIVKRVIDIFSRLVGCQPIKS